MKKEPLLTLEEAAELSKMSTSVLRRAVAKRELACVKLGKLRFRLEHLEGWWARRTQATRRGLEA